MFTDWKKFYFSFDGRVNRKRYWLNFIVPLFSAGIVLAVIEGALGLTYGQYGEYGMLSTPFSLISIWPSLALGAKRLHDREKSGWWQIAPIATIGLAGVMAGIFIPLAILIAIIGAGLGIWISTLIGFLKGTDGANRFGPDPLQDVPSFNKKDDDHDMGAGAQDIQYERVGAGE